jgi:Ca2+/Na+ antiporter
MIVENIAWGLKRSEDGPHHSTEDGLMSGATGTAQQPVVPSWTWVAHLALVLAVASITMAVYKSGSQSALSTIGLAVGVVLAISFGVQAIIARRAARTRMASAAYLLALAGAVAMVWSRFVGSIDAASALGGVAIVFFVVSVVLLELERRRRNRDTLSV